MCTHRLQGVGSSEDCGEVGATMGPLGPEASLRARCRKPNSIHLGTFDARKEL